MAARGLVNLLVLVLNKGVVVKVKKEQVVPEEAPVHTEAALPNKCINSMVLGLVPVQEPEARDGQGSK